MTNRFGSLLRQVRTESSLSQLALSSMADVSPRHLSFLETGRASPSREMVMRLGEVMSLPLRTQNVLLEAAGFVAAYRETSLAAPEMAEVRRAIELLLRQSEPFAAVAFDRSWNIVLANDGYVRALQLLVGHTTLVPYALVEGRKVNALRELFDPNGLRPHIANWEEVASAIVPRLVREAQGSDEVLRLLARELLAYPGVPSVREVVPRPPLVIPVVFRVGDATLRFFTTITTLGTPQDITLEGLRIESFHPSDPETAALVHALSATT